jgi:hypothetical protein
VSLTGAKRASLQSVAQIGDSVVVRGYDFLPGNAGAGVDIVVSADTVARGIGVRPNGTFTISLPTERTGPGVLVVSAVQRNGRQLTIARGSIDVVTRDGRPH